MSVRFSSIGGGGAGVGVDLHTKLFLPPLCSCTERIKSNCLHQSDVFISFIWCIFGVTVGEDRKCRMEIVVERD